MLKRISANGHLCMETFALWARWMCCSILVAVYCKLYLANWYIPTWGDFTLWCVACACGPVALVVLLKLLEIGGLHFEPHSLGVSGSGLASPWYVARYSWDIEEVELRMGYRPAETWLNRGPYQPSDSWYTCSRQRRSLTSVRVRNRMLRKWDKK